MEIQCIHVLLISAPVTLIYVTCEFANIYYQQIMKCLDYFFLSFRGLSFRLTIKTKFSSKTAHVYMHIKLPALTDSTYTGLSPLTVSP